MFSWNFVTPNIATGAHLDEDSDVQELLAHGISDVLDLQVVGESQDARWLASHPALRYLNDGTPDDGRPKPPEWFSRAWDFFVEMPADGKLYVHCKAGFNRGPSVCYYLLRRLGWTPWQAWCRVKLRRPRSFFFGARYIPDAERALVGDQTSPDVWV